MLIRATLKGKTVFLEAKDNGDALMIKNLPSATRTTKMPPLTWMMPLTFETVDALRTQRIPVSKDLAEAARAMLAARRYVNRMKDAELVEPARPIPIKEGFKLFNHQVKAFNIALALYGYDMGGEA